MAQATVGGDGGINAKKTSLICSFNALINENGAAQVNFLLFSFFFFPWRAKKKDFPAKCFVWRDVDVDEKEREATQIKFNQSELSPFVINQSFSVRESRWKKSAVPWRVSVLRRSVNEMNYFQDLLVANAETAITPAPPAPRAPLRVKIAPKFVATIPPTGIFLSFLQLLRYF